MPDERRATSDSQPETHDPWHCPGQDEPCAVSWWALALSATVFWLAVPVALGAGSFLSHAERAPLSGFLLGLCGLALALAFYLRSFVDPHPPSPRKVFSPAWVMGLLLAYFALQVLTADRWWLSIRPLMTVCWLSLVVVHLPAALERARGASCAAFLAAAGILATVQDSRLIRELGGASAAPMDAALPASARPDESLAAIVALCAGLALGLALMPRVSRRRRGVALAWAAICAFLLARLPLGLPALAVVFAVRFLITGARGGWKIRAAVIAVLAAAGYLANVAWEDRLSLGSDAFAAKSLLWKDAREHLLSFENVKASLLGHGPKASAADSPSLHGAEYLAKAAPDGEALGLDGGFWTLGYDLGLVGLLAALGLLRVLLAGTILAARSPQADRALTLGVGAGLWGMASVLLLSDAWRDDFVLLFGAVALAWWVALVRRCAPPLAPGGAEVQGEAGGSDFAVQKNERALAWLGLGALSLTAGLLASFVLWPWYRSDRAVSLGAQGGIPALSERLPAWQALIDEMPAPDFAGQRLIIAWAPRADESDDLVLLRRSLAALRRVTETPPLLMSGLVDHGRLPATAAALVLQGDLLARLEHLSLERPGEIAESEAAQYFLAALMLDPFSVPAHERLLGALWPQDQPTRWGLRSSPLYYALLCERARELANGEVAYEIFAFEAMLRWTWHLKATRWNAVPQTERKRLDADLDRRAADLARRASKRDPHAAMLAARMNILRGAFMGADPFPQIRDSRVAELAELFSGPTPDSRTPNPGR